MSYDAKYFLAALKHSYQHSDFAKQEALADAAGLSRSMVSEMLRGVKAGKRPSHEKIAKAFGYDLDEFLALGRELLDKKGGISTEGGTLSQPEQDELAALRHRVDLMELKLQNVEEMVAHLNREIESRDRLIAALESHVESLKTQMENPVEPGDESLAPMKESAQG